MDTIAPVREGAIPPGPRKCLRFSKKPQTDTADSYEIPSPPSRYVIPSPFTQLSESSGTTLVDLCNHRTPTAKNSRLSTPTVLLDHQWAHKESTKKEMIRSIFRNWRQKLPKPNGNTTTSPTAVQPPGSIAGDYLAHLSADFSVLIEWAISNHPSQTRSIHGICKDIMLIDDWYRTHKKSGWQQFVAQELAENPKFQPVIHCRKGKIQKGQIFRWRLASTSPVDVRHIPWQPHVMSRVRFEMPDTTVKDTSEDTAPSPEIPASKSMAQKSPSYAGTIGASAIPLNQQPQFDSALMDSTPHPARRSTTTLIDCYPEDSGTGTDRTTGKQPMGKIGPHDCSSAGKVASSGSGIEEWELYIPMDMNIQHTTFNGHQSEATQSTRSPQQSDRSNNDRGNTHPGYTLGSGFDGQHGPGHPDDGNGDRKRKRFCRPEEYKSQRRFACVYHKYDPETYGVPNRRYMVCASGFRYISELIRHFERVHDEYICGKCLQQFDNDQLLASHKNQCTVQPGSQEELWAGLWHARFPNIPAPNSRYLANSLRPPQPRLETHLELSLGQADSGGSNLSSAHPSTPSLLLETASHSSNPSTLPSTPNDNIQRDRDLAFQTSARMRLMEFRIDSLERRLPVIEDTLTFVLSSDIESEVRVPAFRTTAQAAHSGAPQTQCARDLAPGDLHPFPDLGALQVTGTTSNYALVESSCASSSGSRSRSHSNQDMNADGLDHPTMLEKNDFFSHDTGDVNGDLPDLSMPDVPDLYIERCDDPFNRAIQLLPDA